MKLTRFVRAQVVAPNCGILIQTLWLSEKLSAEEFLLVRMG